MDNSDRSTDGDNTAIGAVAEVPIPKNMLEVLSNKQQLLPIVESVTLTFQLDDPCELYKTRDPQYDDPGTLNLYPAYSLMNETYKAVSLNAQIKSLTINGEFPFHSTYWSSHAFQEFIKRLETCELGFWEQWDGEGVRGAYHESQEQLFDFDDYMDNHFLNLKSVTSFSINSSDYIGLDGNDQIWPHNPRILKPGFLPKCQHLKLVGCFISPDLRDFIVSLSIGLRTLTLEDCHAIECDPDAFSEGADLLWETFFNAIAQSQPVLSKLIIENVNIPLTHEGYYTSPQAANETEQIRRIRELIADPLSEPKLFSYTWCEDELGCAFMHIDQNVERFEDVGDQVAYHSLMKVVEANSHLYSISRM
jgi:hypothetical protein